MKTKPRILLITTVVVAFGVALWFALQEIRIRGVRRQNEDRIRAHLGMSRLASVDARTVREALLLKLSVGSTCDQVVAFLERIETSQIKLTYTSFNRANCSRAEIGELSLGFLLGRQPLWGVVDEGLDTRFVFDEQKKLRDIVVFPSS